MTREELEKSLSDCLDLIDKQSAELDRVTETAKSLNELRKTSNELIDKQNELIVVYTERLDMLIDFVQKWHPEIAKEFEDFRPMKLSF